MRPIEEIRKAFQLIHRVASGQSDRAYMSIPADPERDADLIVSAALDELEELRAKVALTAAALTRAKELQAGAERQHCAALARVEELEGHLAQWQGIARENGEQCRATEAKLETARAAVRVLMADAVAMEDGTASEVSSEGFALATAAVIGSQPPRFDLVTHLHRQRAFSERTFGPGERTAGVLDHIRKELLELERAPQDLEEWVDVVLLAFDGAWRAGHEPEAIASALEAKQAKNEARKWPDWRTAEPGKAIEHVREEGGGDHG